ncbi:MAG: co-chaperone GroES [Nitrospirota bacterium]
MKFKPLRDRVLVKYSDEPEKSSGGLFIPETAKEKPQKGEVIEVGPGRLTDDGKVIQMEIKIGDTVLFEKYSGSKINLEEIEHLIIREDDILGIVQN